MHEFLTIFLINLLTSIDNAVILGSIVKQYRYLLLVGAVSAVVLTICRTGMIMGVVALVKWPGLRLALGLIVLVVAFSIANAKSDTRHETSFWRILALVVVTDLALSLDNILSIAVVARNPVLIGTSVLLSLLPLLLLLPLIVRVMNQIEWLRILAAGFVAELAVDSITDDPALAPWVPPGNTRTIVILRVLSAAIVILYGIWRTYFHNRRISS